MGVEEFGQRLAAALGTAGVTVGVSGGQAYARATVDVPADRWAAALHAARSALACDFFDWLSAVDDGPAGMSVVAHVWSTTQRRGLLVRTRLPADALRVPSVVDVYPGAAWHERETHEMFGVDFPGHPGGLAPLLLPPEFEGHPLRKDFVLASRVAKAWPGAKEPGEAAGGGRRAPARPPGVPDPAEWGPAARPVPSPASPAPAGAPAPGAAAPDARAAGAADGADAVDVADPGRGAGSARAAGPRSADTRAPERGAARVGVPRPGDARAGVPRPGDARNGGADPGPGTGGDPA